MKKRLPPLNWLRTFEVSAKRLNFTQAAQELNLTQAAVSQQIKGLESQLGVQLFKRLPRGIELTQAGKSYIPIVNESIERLMIATNELFGPKNQQSLQIQVSLVFFTQWLAPFLGEFQQLHPEIELCFTSNIWTNDQPKEADLEIRHGFGKWQGFATQRLSWDELVPVCSPNYLAKININEEKQDLDIFKNSTLLHVIGYSEGWAHWLAEQQMAELIADNNMQFDSLIPALELAVHGQGFALGRSCLINNLLNNKLLVAPIIGDMKSVKTSEAFYLLQPSIAPIHPNAELFCSWLINKAKAINYT